MGPLSVCLSVSVSVMLVYCGQTVGWIKMKLGVQVGLGPGHIALDADPAPSPLKAHIPHQFPAHTCCGQMAGWIKIPLGMEVGLVPGDFVLDGDPAPPPKGGGVPQFSVCLLWPNGWMQQDATWYGDRPSPLPNFRPMSIVAKRLDGWRWHLAWRWASAQATLCNILVLPNLISLHWIYTELCVKLSVRWKGNGRWRRTRRDFGSLRWERLDERGVFTVIPRLRDTTGCQTVWQPVWQPVVLCIQTFNQLSKRFDNRLYRVNGALKLQICSRVMRKRDYE